MSIHKPLAELSAWSYRFGGACERALKAKCRWEQMSRLAVLREWPSLADVIRREREP